MSKAYFRKFASSDREMTQVQNNVDRAVSHVQQIPILNGTLLENIALVTGDNTVEHKLGRKIRGYIVVRISAASTLYDKMSTDTTLDQKFTLNSSAACTVSLWVF